MNPSTTAAERLDEIAADCIRQFEAKQAALLVRYDAEALHKARVALRRLRTAFWVFRPLLDKDAKAKHIEKEMRRLAAKTGEVRNLDILAQRLAERPVPAVVRARGAARRRVQEELASAQSRDLMADLAEWRTSGRWRRSPRANDPIAEFAAARLDTAFKRLLRAGRGVEGLSEKRLHKFRIKTKKARYAAAFFEALWTGREASSRKRAWLARIEALQDDLGALNDIAIGRKLLAELAGIVELPGVDEGRIAALRANAAADLSALSKQEPFWSD